MDMARLNFAHGDAAQHAETAARIRNAAERAGREVAILGDIPGPKLRHRPGGRRGGRARPRLAGRAHPRPRGRHLGAPARGLGGLRGARGGGGRGYLADGAVRLRVSSVAGADVVTNVEVGGSVASRQGLNLPNVTVSLPAVSEDDIALIDAGLEMGVDYFALSFVRRREDLEPVREHLRARGSPTPLIAKIEKPQAAASSEEIVDAADGDHGGPRRPGRRDADRGGPARAEAPAGAGRAAGQAGDHGHADAGVDGALHAAHPRRGGRRGQRDLRRHRRRDALPGDGRGPPPRARGGDDGQHRRDHRARAAIRALAGRARAAGQQPVPRHRLRRRGRRLPAGPQVRSCARPTRAPPPA